MSTLLGTLSSGVSDSSSTLGGYGVEVESEVTVAVLIVLPPTRGEAELIGPSAQKLSMHLRCS